MRTFVIVSVAVAAVLTISIMFVSAAVQASERTMDRSVSTTK